MNKLKGLKNIFIYIFSFVFLLLIINTYFLSITKINGESMYPSFSTGERVMYSKFSSYSPTSSYKSGDIVVCRFGLKEYKEDNTVVQNNTATFIKRIIAVEGDTVEIANGRFLLNGEDITEKYWNGTIIEDSLLKTEIPKGHVFVVGDNINNSIDSRTVGCLPYSYILGKVIYRIPSFDYVG